MFCTVKIQWNNDAMLHKISGNTQTLCCHDQCDLIKAFTIRYDYFVRIDLLQQLKRSFIIVPVYGMKRSDKRIPRFRRHMPDMKNLQIAIREMKWIQQLGPGIYLPPI